MIYALVGSKLTVTDREAIVRAINSADARSLVQYVRQGTLRHVLDVSRSGGAVDIGEIDGGVDPEGLSDETGPEDFHCIWCLDVVRPSRRNGPHGQNVAAPWYYMHSTNNVCIGREHQIGGTVSLNPRDQGCYVAMGCEQVPARNRRDCQCIADGGSYCDRATNPPRSGGPCM